jgi:protein-S-isoprenylcysteine O-methyltransferase Ste14
MNIYVLLAGTVSILVFSWFFSVKHKRYHGIPRFFAFESVFILFLMNYRFWFSEPFSPIHILSWIVLIISAYVGLEGYFRLKREGKPVDQFENTSLLVKSGIYRYIRHPLYLSVFMVGIGIMLKDPGTIQLVLGAILLAAIYLTSITEEDEMIARFGDEYREYMKESKMFIPFVL